MNINFESECSVFIIGKSDKSEQALLFHYERPQLISDEELTKEAKVNFEDMKRRKLQNVQELIGIFIARNQNQLNELEKQYTL